MATAMLSARRDAGGGLFLVTLRVPDELAGRYIAPGQYVEVIIGADSGYFVLAGKVGAAEWELLVRMNGGASDALIALSLGETVEVMGPLGNGFPLSRAQGRPLVVAVAGSALAVARPIVRARIATREASTTRIYLGVRSARDVGLVFEIESWVEAGVRMVLCLSKSEIGHDPDILPRVRREVGYVQTALERAIQAGELLGNVIVFAAGPEPMLSDMRSRVWPASASMTLEVVTNV